MNYEEKYFQDYNGVNENYKYPLTPCTIHNWRQHYTDKLPDAIREAKHWIRKGILAEHQETFHFLRTNKTDEPLFQHLCFQYLGNTYSVLIELCINGESMLRSHHIHNQKNMAEQNNFIPCTIQLDYYTLQPLVPVSHLINTQTRTRIIYPTEMQHNPMSSWEIQNIGIAATNHKLKEDGSVITSFFNMSNVEPHIWFEKDQKKCYVIVEAGTEPYGIKEMNGELIAKLSSYQGYYAYIQISKVFLNDTRDNILYRGDNYSCTTTITPIEQAALKQGTDNKIIDTIY